MTQQAIVTWQSDMAFEATVNGHQLIMDVDASGGGDDRSFRSRS